MVLAKPKVDSFRDFLITMNFRLKRDLGLTVTMSCKLNEKTRNAKIIIMYKTTGDPSKVFGVMTNSFGIIELA